MKKLFLLCIAFFATISIAEAQIIRSSRGVVRENTVKVEKEEPEAKPKVDVSKWRTIGNKSQTIAIDFNYLSVRYQMEKRFDEIFSFGWGASLGFATGAFGSVRMDLFPETLSQSSFMPYFGLNGGVGTHLAFDVGLDALFYPHIGFNIAEEQYMYGAHLGILYYPNSEEGELSLSIEFKF